MADANMPIVSKNVSTGMPLNRTTLLKTSSVNVTFSAAFGSVWACPTAVIPTTTYRTAAAVMAPTAVFELAFMCISFYCARRVRVLSSRMTGVHDYESETGPGRRRQWNPDDGTPCACTPFICSGIRHRQAGYLERHSDEDVMGESPRMDLHRRQGTGRQGYQLGHRGRSSERPAAARPAQHRFPGWRRGRRRRIPGKERRTGRQREDRDVQGRPEFLPRRVGRSRPG